MKVFKVTPQDAATVRVQVIYAVTPPGGWGVQMLLAWRFQPAQALVMETQPPTESLLWVQLKRLKANGCTQSWRLGEFSIPVEVVLFQNPPTQIFVTVKFLCLTEE